MESIQVFVVDGVRQSRQLLRTMIAREDDLELVGSASSVESTVALLLEHDVDIVVVNDNIEKPDMPKAIWQITSAHRDIGVVAIGKDSGSETLRRYILAGARGFVPHPLDGEDLHETIHKVYENIASERQARLQQQTPPTKPLVVRHSGDLGHVVAVFGAKGGVGKTTLTVNLSVALSQLTDTRTRVGVVDADLAFGDIGLLFDLTPATTILDLVEHLDSLGADAATHSTEPDDGDAPGGRHELDHEFLKGIMVRHEGTGIRVLLCPTRPEHADLVDTRHINHLLSALPRLYDFIVLDCPVAYEERILLILEHADQLLFVVTPEVGALKNARGFLNVAEALGFERDRISVVLNRANSQVDITPGDIEEWLAFPVDYNIVSGGAEVARAANRGVPLFLSSPNHPVSRGIVPIAEDVIRFAEETRREKHTGMLRASLH